MKPRKDGDFNGRAVSLPEGRGWWWLIYVNLLIWPDFLGGVVALEGGPLRFGCWTKNRGGKTPPKMDGENNGKAYEQMDDLGGFYHPYFWFNTHFHECMKCGSFFPVVGWSDLKIFPPWGKKWRFGRKHDVSDRTEFAGWPVVKQVVRPYDIKLCIAFGAGWLMNDGINGKYLKKVLPWHLLVEHGEASFWE